MLIFRQFLGPSPALYVIKKVHSHIFFHGGDATDQALFNSDCKVKSTEIPNAIDLVSHDLGYNNMVNIQDVTGLDRVDFSDVLHLGQAKAKPRKVKLVNFLDKFGDSGPINLNRLLWTIDS